MIRQKPLHKTFFLFVFGILLFGCSPAPKIAVSDSGWQSREELPVKGAQGFLFKQRLSFGEFKTTTVKRSWTRGSEFTYTAAVPVGWVDRLSVQWVQRRQALRFQLADDAGNESEVTAFARVSWQDLTVGENPASVVNIIGDILGIGDDGSNTYAVQILTAKNDLPWQMVIDNNAAQRKAKTYTGLLAKSRSEYYIIAPVYRLVGKNGKPVSLPFGGSFGFEFRSQTGEVLAAVSLINGGTIYFGKVDAKEKFLFANAAAALLLQEQIAEGG